MILEMFFWDKPLGMKTFKMTQAHATATKVLAMNQGLYNGFLAAGLFWGLFNQDFRIQCFFLICVIVAGIFGALTASKGILYIQAAPAIVALSLVVWRYLS